MKYGLILDGCIVALFIWGYIKGYRRGIFTMAVPLISFIVGAIALKTLGSLAYAIFGEGLENLVRNFLLKRVVDGNIVNIIFQQMLNESLIKKTVQMFVFVVVYVIGASVTSTILRSMKLKVNNAFLNSLDKNFGGVIGVLSQVITVFLILGITSVLGGSDIGGSNIEQINAILQTSYIGSFLYKINPIMLLLG